MTDALNVWNVRKGSKKADREKRLKQYNVRISQAEYDSFKRAALADDRTLSNWTRHHLREAAKDAR